MPTCRTGWVKPSSGLARSTPRLIPIGVRSTVRPAFRKASNNLILALVKTGKGPEAVERARALVAESPGDTDRYFTLGLAQSEQDVDGAIADLPQGASDGSAAHARQIQPRARPPEGRSTARGTRRTRAHGATDPRPEAHYTMGIIYWHQGDLDRATPRCAPRSRLTPSTLTPSSRSASVFKARRDWTGSTAALQRAVEIRPDPATYYTLSQVRQLDWRRRRARVRSSDEAERLRTACSSSSTRHSSATSVGIQKVESGDLLAAVDNFRRATAVFDAYAPAHYQLGLVFERLGEHEASRSAFERARQLNPSLVSPRNTR